MASKFNPGDYGLEADASGRFSAACALYWHCADYHEGQGSERYRIMSMLGYKPGACENGPEKDSIDELLYNELASGEVEPAEVAVWIASVKGDDDDGE